MRERLFFEHRGGLTFYSCKMCRTYLSNKEEVVSTKFQGASGKAFLFARAWNIVYLEAQQREMMTGAHLVRDVACKNCSAKLGWMYEMAFVPDQRYKEAKIILEKSLIFEENGIDPPVSSTHVPPIVEPPSELTWNPERKLEALSLLCNPPPPKKKHRRSKKKNTDDSLSVEATYSKF